MVGNCPLQLRRCPVSDRGRWRWGLAGLLAAGPHHIYAGELISSSRVGK